MFLEGFDNIEQLAKRTPQPVKANDGERVAGADVVEQVGEAWTIEGFSGNHVLKDAERAGGFEAVSLAGEVLVVGRDAGIAENVGHGRDTFTGLAVPKPNGLVDDGRSTNQISRADPSIKYVHKLHGVHKIIRPLIGRI